MARYDQLFVYKSCYDLLLALYRDLNKLPRDVKYSLLQDIKKDTRTVLCEIYHANAVQDKGPYIEKALENIMNVKIGLRLLWDMKHISEKKYGALLELSESVSKQLTAWLRSANIKTVNPQG